MILPDMDALYLRLADDVTTWISPQVVKTLGWTLVHFLWQGLALVGLCQALTLRCQTARARYNLAFATLVAMAAAPFVTFIALTGASDAADGADAPFVTPEVSLNAVPSAATFVSSDTSSWLNWVVAVWMAGVVLLSLRVAGGWYVAHRLRRQGVSPLPRALRLRFQQLRANLGIARPVIFLQSARVNAPAVVGWLRPVVLIPASAIMGLTPAQLEAVIMHELAHIRRLDVAANLLQMLVETVLFYHPAVWWISRRIRIEREHCCDDVAVSWSGDALAYAKALASLEEWRAVMSPALSAGGGVLKQRISRLLGLSSGPGHVPLLGVMIAGFICLAGSVMAHSADADSNFPAIAPLPALELAADIPAPTSLVPLVPPPAPPAVPAPDAAVQPPVPPTPAQTDADYRDRARELQRQVSREQAEAARDAARDARREARKALDDIDETNASPFMKDAFREARRALDDSQQADADDDHDRDRGRSRRAKHDLTPEEQTYVAALENAGAKDVNADDVESLRNGGVTPEYVREIAAAGYNPRARQLLAFKNQGIDATYINTIAAAGLKPSASQLIAFKAQKIDPAFIRDVHTIWPEASAGQIISLRARNVTPDYIKAVRAAWPDVSVHDLSGLIAMDVSAADVAEYRKAGVDNLSAKQIITYKALGVTPEFVRMLQGAGIKDLSAKDYAAAKARGITPAFLESVRKHGFSNLTMRQLLMLKDADVL